MREKNAVACLTLLLALFMSTAVFANALESFKNESGTLRIAGGTAHIPVVKEAAARIMRFNPDIQISIAGGGSGLGIKQVGDGLIDIGNSGRKAKEDEISRYGLVMFKWAIDGVASVVHPDNPVRSLSKDQMKDIYSGKITNWQELGGTKGVINLYTRDDSSGTREVFWKKGLDKGDISSSANFVASNGAMKAAISQDPNGIGYVSVGHIDETIFPVTFDGVHPDLETVKTGKYTIARGLYSNTKGNPAGLAKKFIDYLLSDEGQQIVADKGFIPVQ